LNADELERLEKACKTPWERLVVWTLLGTGLRVSSNERTRLRDYVERGRV
jgi:hypothetical protein